MEREGILERIRCHPEVSVLIIGGGINGAGTFRDLALQGVDVLLVERGDFCSGASAASSHMLHGGIRYLENGEFRLVKEALRERNRLLKNAPHHVKPLPTTIPLFKWLSGVFNAPLKFMRLLDRPAERGALVVKIGLTLYDWYVRSDRILPPHHFLGRDESLEQYPELNPAILYTATYYDAWMPSPERLCLEVLLDGEAANAQAHALNYLSVTSASGNTVVLRDEVRGELFPVRPTIVVNAAGPWIDLVNRAMRRETRLIGGTKGSHLVLDHPPLRAQIGDREFFFENDDGRIVLILPFFDKVMVGTSDIRVDDPDNVRCTDEEVDYFIRMIEKVFPRIRVDRSHIVFTFTGVRPLPASNVNSPGLISRDHSIWVTEPDDKIAFPVYSLVGGKWTSFRAFSEQATDQVLRRLGVTRIQDTRDLAIGGGHGYPLTDDERERWLAGLHQEVGLPRERLMTLLERYGTRAEEIARFVAQGDDVPLTYHPDYSRREIQFIASQEKVVHLADLLLRRTLLGMLGQLHPALVHELAGIVGETLSWTDEEQHREVELVYDLLLNLHRVDLKLQQMRL